MLSKGSLKFINSLHIKKYRQQHNLFTVEGKKNILELLKSDFIIQSVYVTEEEKGMIPSDIKEVTVCSQSEIEKASFFKTNSFGIAIVEIPTVSKEDRVEDWILALDQVKDPGNLGTIVRAADWYGIKTILCSKDCVDFYNPKVIAATMGSFSRVKVHYVDLVNELGTTNKPIYGAVLGGENIHATSVLEKGVLVMGNESNGVSEEVQSLCTKSLMIPSFGETESLNVAMATSILLDNLKRINP